MGDLAAENFALWLTPADAIQRVPVGSDAATKQRWIMRRLASGDIKAAAAKSKIKDQRGSRGATYAPIPPHVWRHPWHGVYPDFWDTGDVELSNREEMIGVVVVSPDDPPDRFTRGDSAVFFDVRFDPSGFPLPHPGTKADSDQQVAPSSKPPLSEALLTRWHELFIVSYPSGSIRVAETSAAGMFPEHHVSRQRIRALFPDRPPDRPRKTDNNS